MKCLKEPISRRANRQDKCRGAFFESRFKSAAVLDEEALLAISPYIDLNAVAAKIADLPETSNYTSIKSRVDHVKAQDVTAQLEAAKGGSVAGSREASGLEDGLWLCPIEDRRRWDSPREGMFEGLSIGSYLRLVDYTREHRHVDITYWRITTKSVCTARSAMSRPRTSWPVANR